MRYKSLLFGLTASSLMFMSCGDDDVEVVTEFVEVPISNGFLASNLEGVDIDLGDDATIPRSYVESGVLEGDDFFGPAKYSGQLTRRAQLGEIVGYLKDEPIAFDVKGALSDGELFDAAGDAYSTGTKLIDKIDELNYDNGDQSVAESFQDLADSIKVSSSNYATVASNGLAGKLDGRHFSANGLEYAQIIEKGLFGPLFYNQMVDDYLRPSQSGALSTNNETDAGTDYPAEGTARQHAFDEAFGYFGAEPLSYPNVANSSNGDGEFIANYTFDFSDETEEAFGINLSEKIMEAFIIGRATLKAGEGQIAADETTNEEVYDAARADIILYVEAGIAAAAYHYLNSSIDDTDDADKLHHISEALGFIYALGFNSQGQITQSEVFAVLQELGWGGTSFELEGVYDVNLWEVTDAQLQAAKDLLDNSFPGFGDVAF